jgi:NADH pyrophosphatase NudC (nudix superfamily)
MANNLIEQPEEINYCPYCGSDMLIIEDETSLSCEECGHDFTVMTHG